MRVSAAFPRLLRLDGVWVKELARSASKTTDLGHSRILSIDHKATNIAWADVHVADTMRGVSDEPVEVEEEPGPPPLDPEVRARRDAALRMVCKYGDPVLRSRALEIDRFDARLVEEARRMGQVMHDAMGIGLAATQVGAMHRVLVYRVEPDSPVAALVNPRVLWRGREEEIAEEGCLSLPGVHVEVERPVHVRVEGHDERGDRLTIEASGLEARVLQHEIDHLDGVLILDRTTRSQRKEAMKALRERLAEDEPRRTAA